MHEDENAMIALALSGDQKAYAWLMHKHRSSIFHIINRMVRDEEAALDLVQETFLAAVRTRAFPGPRLPPPGGRRREHEGYASAYR